MNHASLPAIHLLPCVLVLAACAQSYPLERDASVDTVDTRDAPEASDARNGVCAGEPAGTPCRSAVGPCDAVERCNGSTDTCPADAMLPEGTACADDDGPGLCAGGECVSVCIEGGGCVGANPCAEGVIRCEGGVPVCEIADDSNVQCDGECVNTQSDNQHCGACGNACGELEGCVEGDCEPSVAQCTPGAPCSPSDDPCAAGTIRCEGGVGFCEAMPSSEIRCDGTCVDAQTSARHCGRCGNSCPASESCIDGLCLPRIALCNSGTVCDFTGGGPCDRGITQCVGRVAFCILDPFSPILCGDECIDVQSDPAHCGRCSRACAPGESCDAGRCVRPPTGCEGRLDGTVCGPVQTREWTECTVVSGAICSERGGQSRSTFTPTCIEGECVSIERREGRSCPFDTDGIRCGETPFRPFSECGGFDGPCDETGTERRRLFDRVCGGGECQRVAREETRDCERDTDGNRCPGGACSEGRCVTF